MKYAFFFTVLIALGGNLFAQTTYYSTNHGGDARWANPANWSYDVAGLQTASEAPRAKDHVVIRDSIYHHVARPYKHRGNVKIEVGGVYQVYTGKSSSAPYIFAGDEFRVGGHLITSSDFEHQEEGTVGYGQLVFESTALITIGDDLILNAFGEIIVNTDSCGDGVAFDDIYFVGTGARVCGSGKFVVPHQIRVWNDLGLELTARVANNRPAPPLSEQALQQLSLQLCDDFRFYQDTESCRNSEKEIIIGKGDSSLPVEYMDIHAEIAEDHVALHWISARELNNDFYTVEKSLDAKNFSAIATREGAGTSEAPLAYVIEDYTPFKGLNYYRIKQTDFDGKESYSPLLAVQFSDNLAQVRVAKSPVQDQLKVFINGFDAHDRFICHLLDLQGRELLSHEVQCDAKGSAEARINHVLPKGTYLLRVDNIHFVEVKRITL